MSTRFKALAWLTLAVVVATGLLMGWALLRAHWVAQGESTERARWEALQAEETRQAAELRTEQQRQAQRAAAAAIDSERQARTFSLNLALERQHAVLTHPVAPVACAAGAVDRGDQPGGQLAPDTTAVQAPPDAPAAHAPVYLTADAVRLWNAALTGREPPPEDSRGADAGAAGAAPARLTVQDAWDNQAENALRCRIDRDRYRALIDLLHRYHQD